MTRQCTRKARSYSLRLRVACAPNALQCTHIPKAARWLRAHASPCASHRKIRVRNPSAIQITRLIATLLRPIHGSFRGLSQKPSPHLPRGARTGLLFFNTGSGVGPDTIPQGHVVPVGVIASRMKGPAAGALQKPKNAQSKETPKPRPRLLHRLRCGSRYQEVGWLGVEI